MYNKSLILDIISLSFFVFIVTSCSPQSETKKPIKIAINAWPGYAHAYLAQEKGFFKKNNVDVDLVLKTTSPESLKLYTDRDVEGCFTTLADTLMINSTGNPAKIVCIIDYSNSGDVIIGRSEIESLSALKGKTVSFEEVNSFSHIFVLTALIKAGLQEYDVKFENIHAQGVLKALEEKKIDAGHTWEPIKSQALKRGYKILSKAGDYPGIIADVLIFTPDVIKDQPNKICAIVKSLFEALDYLKTNRDESIKIMADSMKMETKEMDAGIESIFQPNLEKNLALMPTPATTTAATATTTPLLADLINMIMDFYLKRGQLFSVVDVDDIIDSKFLKLLSGETVNSEKKTESEAKR